MDGWMDWWMYGWIDQSINRSRDALLKTPFMWMDRWMDGWMDGWLCQRNTFLDLQVCPEIICIKTPVPTVEMQYGAACLKLSYFQLKVKNLVILYLRITISFISSNSRRCQWNIVAFLYYTSLWNKSNITSFTCFSPEHQ